MYDNNIATISGEIMGEFEFSHEIFGEGFYITQVASRRLSQIDDFIPIVVSEKLVDLNRKWGGETVKILGNFRSRNLHERGKSKLILSLFARNFETCELMGNDENSIYLSGYVCKKPVYRKTPLGKRITDLILAVNRPYGKSDYIPCICWGENAKFSSNLNIGDKCDIQGRIQSRDYLKKISDNDFESRIAYEISVEKIDVVEKEII